MKTTHFDFGLHVGREEGKIMCFEKLETINYVVSYAQYVCLKMYSVYAIIAG